MTSFLQKINDSEIFRNFTLFLIVTSAAILGLNTYDLEPEYRSISQIALNVISILFVFEITIRIFSENKKKNFFQDSWNNFDLFIVVISLFPAQVFESFLIFRLFRIFRILRFISILPELRLITEGVIKSIRSAFSIMIILLLIMFIYGVIGAVVFPEVEGFNNLGDSFLTLFQVLTLSSWEEVMERTQQSYTYSWVYFISFIFLASIMILNLFIAVLVDVVARIKIDDDK